MNGFDQQNFNNDISEMLGAHGAKLDILLSRTEPLSTLIAKVEKHETNLKVINRVASMFGVGVISAAVAFFRSKFGHTGP